MPNVQSFSTLRARSYVFRLPLFTRCIAFLIVALWMVGVQSVWDLRQWGALIPDEFNFQTGKWRLYPRKPPATQGSPTVRFVRRRRAKGGGKRRVRRAGETDASLAGLRLLSPSAE